jgi:putative DNA primase/helicase
MLDDYKNIPNILKDLNIWLCYDDRAEDNKKAPRDLKGKLHSINGKLFSYKECIESINNGFNSGLGIVLKNGIVCIDYDNCISSYKKIDKLGLKIPIFKDDVKDRIVRDIDLINSYTEISPSGKGIHIYLMANSKINTNQDNIEIYTNKFIRVSGNLYNEDMYNDISEDKTSELEQLLNIYGLNINDYDSFSRCKDTIDKDILDKKFKYHNTFTNKQILDNMFKGKKGTFYRDLYNNTLSDADYKQFKIDKLDALLSGGKITQERYTYLLSKLDTSNSGKAFTLIINLLDYCYGDTTAVYNLFKASALCKDDYLQKRYARGKEDIIINQFIPKAIKRYINFRELD